MNNTSQQDRILGLLRSRKNEWVPLPEILKLMISQYGSRILELRAKGFQIENRNEWVESKRHSWFRLVEKQKEEQLVMGEVDALV